MDFFIVPTATFRVLYVLVIMAHERQRVVHFNITESPTSAWTAQQITNAFPEDTAPRFVLRDRDGVYGAEVVRRIRNMGIEQKLIAPRSPWQNPFVERLNGTIRRECLDRVIILSPFSVLPSLCPRQSRSPDVRLRRIGPALRIPSGREEVRGLFVSPREIPVT